MIVILLILILSACSKSEVVQMPTETKGIDTTYTSRVADSTETRQPIRFDVTVGDWKEITIE
jgi:hypothetical protein